MDRKTFIQQLEQLLRDWPDPQEREEQILYYEEMLVDLTDEQASQRIDQLGGPQKVAQELRKQKGLPPVAQTASAAEDAQASDWGWDAADARQSQQTAQSDLKQKLAQRKEKNRRRTRMVIAAVAAVVVLLAVAVGACVWMLTHREQPGSESGAGSSSQAPSSVAPSSAASGAASGSDSGAASGSDSDSSASSGSQTSDSAASGSQESLPVSGQLPEGVEQATSLKVDASGAELVLKSGDEWVLATGEEAIVQSGLEQDCLNLKLGSGAFVLTVPAGVTDIEITADKGRLDLRQLETEDLQLEISNADAELETVTASELTVKLQQGNMQAADLVLAEELDLDLQNGNAQIVLQQPESYGYTVECQQGNLVLDKNSWNGEAQPQQAQQAGEGLQFEIKVKQGSGSITFEPAQQA